MCYSHRKRNHLMLSGLVAQHETAGTSVNRLVFRLNGLTADEVWTIEVGCRKLMQM